MGCATLTTTRHHQRDRERLQRHLRENFSDPTLSVASSSAALFMSVRYVQKVFAQAGTTPLEWLLQCRTAEAMRLLAGTEMPVHEIATRVGYRDVSQFSRSFKRRTSLSPSEHRARARN